MTMPTCSGCGARREDVLRYVLDGKTACCPDCDALTLTERNLIRAALHKAKEDGIEIGHFKGVMYAESENGWAK